MNRTAYSCLLYLSTPLLLLRLLWRSLRSPAYLQRWSERFAFYSGSKKQHRTSLVFHAVSVGEVHAVIPLISQLLANDSGLEILVTTSTPTGSARVSELLGNKVQHVYLPYDYPGAVSRFLERFQPRVIVMMETELWPNLIHQCAKKRVSLVLANARLSEKSFITYRKISGLAREMLQQLNAVSAQSEKDAQRLEALGCPGEVISISGSMKFDMAFNHEHIKQASVDKQAMNGRPVFVAASTRAVDGDMEEEKVIAAFKQMLLTQPLLLLVLVPRHPERFDEVSALVEKSGLSVVRKSDELAVGNNQVLLGDSMGDMHYYLGLADVAFVGGSLVPTGCQNIIEPAAMGIPVVTGPSLFNFNSASDALLAAKAMQVVISDSELARVVTDLLGDNENRLAMGQAGREVVKENQGATDRNLAVIKNLLAAS